MYDYDFLNVYNGRRTPSTIHANSTEMTAYFRRYLFQKAISVLKWDNVPDTWSLDYMLYVLYSCGYVCVLKTDKYGVIPQYGLRSGYNIYYQPKGFIVSSPILGSQERTIGIDGELIKLTPDYYGILDMIDYYADLLAVAAEDMGINMVNTKLAYFFAAKNKAFAEAFKKAFDKMQSGEPAVVVGDKFFDDDGNPLWVPFTQDLGKNFISPELLQLMSSLEQKFENDIGIPNLNGLEKKERLISDEVNMNNAATFSKGEQWLDNIRISLERVHKMFPEININVDWRYSQNESVDLNSRPVADGQDNI